MNSATRFTLTESRRSAGVRSQNAASSGTLFMETVLPFVVSTKVSISSVSLS